MSSLADLPELIGFFSYSREDDEDSHGALSALRERIQRELRGQLGRSTKTFRLWQDKEAIGSGKLWEAEIKTGVGQSVFFIPIITPTVVRSPYCKFELESFLAREAGLGRSDLVFPILYVKVPELEDSARRKDDPVLSIIAKRQYLDWREFRHRDVHSTDVKEAVERFCAHICEALDRSWLSPDERKAQEEATARRAAETERKRQDDEAERREGDARQQVAEAQARESADEERRRREAEVEQKRAEAERQRAEDQRVRNEAEARRRAEEEERRRLRQSEARPLWPPSRPALMAGSLIGLAVLGAIGVWLAFVGPKQSSYYDDRGAAYKAKQDYDRAIADYSEAIKIDPEKSSYYYFRGDAYKAKQDYDRAIADYSEAIKIDPKYASAFYNRGLAKQRKGDNAGGRADIAAAKQLDPNVDKYVRTCGYEPQPTAALGANVC
jgi:tetratricopeptide (TPR) repeat protein